MECLRGNDTARFNKQTIIRNRAADMIFTPWEKDLLSLSTDYRSDHTDALAPSLKIERNIPGQMEVQASCAN